MPRLTSYETTRADAWDTGMSDPDTADDDREAAGLRTGWALLNAI